MKKIFLQILFLTGFSAVMNITAAQDYTYKSYTAADGLPSSEILAIAKDYKGFLWIGSSAGISKFDGYTFQNFSHSEDNAVIGHVNVIKQYKSRFLLVGTTSGLFVCSNNTIIKLNKDSPQSNGVSDIFTETDGSLLLATAIGPLKIPGIEIDLTGKTKLSLEKYILPQWRTISDKKVTLISKSADGAVFIAQKFSIYRLYQHKLNQVYSLANIEKHDQVLSIFPVNKSLIYFDGSLSEMNKIENGNISNFNKDKLYTPGILAGNDSIWYAGTSGIFCFHPSLDRASAFINTMDAGVFWPSMVLREKGFFWLATHDGLIKISPTLIRQYPGEAFGKIRETFSVYQLKNNTLLFGANRGQIFIKESDKVSSYFPNNKKAVSLAEIRCMHEDEKNRLWIGSGYQGLVMSDKHQLRRFTRTEGLHDNSVNNIYKARNGDLFAVGDHGISKINTGTGEKVSFTSYRYEARTSLSARFFSAIEAPDETIWVAGEEGLFFLKNDSLNKYQLHNRKISLTDIKMDHQGNVWIAASGEGILLCRFNSSNRLTLVRSYNRTDGLNSLYFLRLLVDARNNIWAGSPKGISCIITGNKTKERIVNFDHKDGFTEPGYSYLNLFEDRTGNIWVATPKGACSFNPQDLLADVAEPEIQLTEIQLLKSGTAYFPNDSVKLGMLQLKHNNNAVQISFSAIDYANQENMSYVYKMEGNDSSWINTQTDRTVSYQNLSPGKYRFRVKALNVKGKWSKEEAIFVFNISAPFWQQWWFIAACILFAVSGIFYFIKRREKIIKQKEAQKTEIQKLKAINYQYQLEIEQVINFFATSINEQQSIDDMLWDVAKNCISKLGFEDCVIYLQDEHRQVLVQKAALGPKTDDSQFSAGSTGSIVNPIEIPIGKGIVGSVATSGKAEIISDTSTDSRYITDDAMRYSEITVPILDDGKVIGIIDSEHQQKNFYTQRHLQILTTVASLCSEKIDKMKAEQQTREKQLEVLQLNNDLATSQLTALRAQMNPHFIFNALNSIQHFILQGNTNEANRYLSSFSKLQREILNNSDQQFITLEKEKEILEIYLDLEKLRLDDNFSYEIRLEDDIDPGEIMIPPMIVQPFVENAIWHGLLPKKGTKTLIIEFHLEDDETLLCSITDNGIGREASGLHKANSVLNKSHKSRGLSLVYERLNILETQFNKPFKVTIEDRKDEYGNSAGTKVNLVLFTRL